MFLVLVLFLLLFLVLVVMIIIHYYTNSLKTNLRIFIAQSTSTTVIPTRSTKTSKLQPKDVTCSNIILTQQTSVQDGGFPHPITNVLKKITFPVAQNGRSTSAQDTSASHLLRFAWPRCLEKVPNIFVPNGGAKW